MRLAAEDEGGAGGAGEGSRSRRRSSNSAMAATCKCLAGIYNVVLDNVLDSTRLDLTRLGTQAEAPATTTTTTTAATATTTTTTAATLESLSARVNLVFGFCCGNKRKVPCPHPCPPCYQALAQAQAQECKSCNEVVIVT